MRAQRGGRDLELRPLEFQLLELFMRNRGRVLTREIISEQIWGYVFPSSNSIEVSISSLRRKLEAGGEPRLIQTRRGFGYELRGP
jgi:two-component system response regulator MprA